MTGGGLEQARLIAAYEVQRAVGEMRSAIESLLRQRSAAGMLNGGNTVALVAAEQGRRAEALFDALAEKLRATCPTPEGFALLSDTTKSFRAECESGLLALFGRHVHSQDVATNERMKAAGMALLATPLGYVEAKVAIARAEFVRVDQLALAVEAKEARAAPARNSPAREGILMAVAALWSGGIPKDMRSETRNAQIRDWLKKNRPHSPPPSVRSIQKALAREN